MMAGSLPLGRALFQEGVDPFALVGAVEQLHECLALLRQCRTAGHAVARRMDELLAGCEMSNIGPTAKQVFFFQAEGDETDWP